MKVYWSTWTSKMGYKLGRPLVEPHIIERVDGFHMTVPQIIGAVILVAGALLAYLHFS